MSLEVHPDARERFDSQADELTGKVTTERESPRRGPPFYREAHSEPLPPPESPIIKHREDAFGNEVARFILGPTGLTGLDESAFGELKRVCERIQKSPNFRNCVSLHAVLDAGFGWVMYQHRKSNSFVEHIRLTVRDQIRDHEMWIPIAGVSVESPFRFGAVEIRNIDSERLARWYHDLIDHGRDESTAGRFLEDKQRNLQGRAACVVECHAEAQWARDDALEKSIDATAMLRLFSPEMHLPVGRSFCVVRGMEKFRSHEILECQQGRLYGESASGPHEPGMKDWLISDARIEQLRHLGLAEASSIAARELRTAFEKRLYESLMLFSKATIVHEPNDKLVYAFSALESMLLRSESEPIQQTIADRVALSFDIDADTRQQFARLFKKAYGLRSRFLHHGHRIDEMRTVSEFLIRVWQFFVFTMAKQENYTSKEEFIDDIDRRKYA